MKNTLRKKLNQIAHKRAREVARLKRAGPAKVGTGVQAEFRTNLRRLP